ncbi:MAG: YciI family protein [Acidimicrobiia bacterium]
MTTFVMRLIAPRPTFALDLTDDERAIMGRHAAHWQPWVEDGRMVVFGPVLDDTGSYGLGVVETDDEDELRAHAAADPVVTTGTAHMEIGRMLLGFVRPR